METFSEASQNTNKFFPTGIQALDQLLGRDFSEDNGFPEGSLVLIQIPPNTNLGTLFAQKLLLNFLDRFQNSRGFYFHSSKPKMQLMKSFEAYNWNIDPLLESGRFELIDMWTITSSHTASSSKIGKIDIKRKTFLKQTYQKIYQIRMSSGVDCFSVVDDLLWLKENELDQRPSKVLEFVKDILDIIFRIGGVHFFILPKGILNDVSERLIMNYSTGLIDFDTEFRGNNLQHLFYIAKLAGVSLHSEILEISPSVDGGFRIESTTKV